MVKSVLLHELVDIYLGLTHTPEYVFEGIPFLSVKNISSGKIDFSQCHYITEKEYNSLPNGAKPQMGDMIFCRVGTIGKPVIIEPNTPRFGSFVSLGFFRLKENNLCKLKYLYYWMYSESFYSQVKKNVKGASQVNLNTNWLSKFEVPMYPLVDQEKIIRKLEHIDKLIALRKQQLAKLDDLVKSRFIELIHSNAPWYVKLKDVVEEGRIITYGIVKPGEHTEGGVPIIKVKDFPNGAILMNDMLLASPEIESKYERSRVKEGDLLFSIRGSVGRTAFVPRELTDANITQDTARLSISENFAPKYVRAALEYDSVQYDINQYVRGVAVRGINLADLREIEIPIVDFNLQRQFAAFAGQTDKSKLEIQQSLEKLETLKKSLMQKYFG